MARRFTPAQQHENRAFLTSLERGGNIRLAAREIGRSNAAMHSRRAACAAFAQRWDVAIAIAQARLAEREGQRGPQAKADRGTPANRTAGGETTVVHGKDGKLQVRRAHPGKLTRACEQAFLAALSATCNVALSAAAVGASPRAFYRRRRQHAGFDREMRLAMQRGYERLEMAMLESSLVDSHVDDAWRSNDPPPMPPMTVNQALQLMYLHQKEARLLSEPAHFKRRRGETSDAQSYRYAVMYELGRQRLREEFDIAEAARRERGEPSPFGPQPPVLPALDQVTGWSRADPEKPAHHEGVALFGGWRLGDMQE